MAHFSVSYGKAQILKVINYCVYQSCILSCQFSAAFIKDLTSYFRVVTSMRPKATRKESSEIYIIAKDFVHIDKRS